MKMVSVYVAQNKGCAVAAAGWKAHAYSPLSLWIITTQREATYTQNKAFISCQPRKIIFLVQLLRQMRTAGYFIS
jgi:hypothetical protein